MRFQQIHWNRLKGKILNHSCGGEIWKKKTHRPRFPPNYENISYVAKSEST